MHQSRTDQHDTQSIDEARSVGTGQFFVIDDLLLECGAAPAIVFRPAHAHPATLMHLAVPITMEFPVAALGPHELALNIVTAACRVRQVRIEPRAKFAPERLRFRAEIEVH